MFERSFLPPAELEFVVLADTHYMRDVGDRPLEFESRRKQTARAGHAMRLAAALDPAFVIHLGDLVQEEPSSVEFDVALDEALGQIAECGLAPRYVAGNHDIGDKPDATMPTHPVRDEDLARYAARVGPSWYSFDADDTHFVVVNSQILNTDLAERETQRLWLETDLQNSAGKRIFLFFHLPAYLGTPADPHFGHYDVIAPPDRDWLLALVRQYAIDTVCAGHVHFAFYDRFHRSDYFILPSTSFTRPGFGHMFSAAPAPERGRDDTPKLGFTLFRLRGDRTDAHFVRTRGETQHTGGRRILTRLPADLPRSPLGLTLRRPLHESHEIPIAYPSLVRQPVRNDYPFLAIAELGIRHVRLPLTDLVDAAQRARVGLLRDRGVSVTATWTDTPEAATAFFATTRGAVLGSVDTLELRAAGSPRPDAASLATLARAANGLGCQVSLAPVFPFQHVPGKQHPRTRVGAAPGEVDACLEEARQAGLRVDRLVVRVPSHEDPAAVIATVDASAAVDFVTELPGVDDSANALFLARATVAVAARPRARLFVEPLRDFDRTMDAVNGLLDGLCNPREPFEVLRALNTILFAHADALRDAKVEPTHAGSASSLALRSAGRTHILLHDDEARAEVGRLPAGDHALFDLTRATQFRGTPSRLKDVVRSDTASRIWLVASPVAVFP